MTENDGSADFLKGFTLAPGWAKSPAERQRRHAAPGEDAPGDDRLHRDRRGARDDARDRPASRRDDREDRRSEGMRRARPAESALTRLPRPSRDDRPASGAPERPRDAAPLVAQPGSSAGPVVPREARFGPRPGGRPAGPPEQPAEYPVEVRLLPDQKALAVVMHKVARGHRAFPIRDLAKLFLDNPASCEVRIEVKAGHPDLSLHQCTRCGSLATTEGDFREHAFAVHFEEEFAAEQVEGEPPSGVFVGVARCGITRKLLAPPNHHSYNGRILEMLRTECRHVPEDAYRAKIEMVHDAALVQQWRELSRMRTLYRRKAQAPAEEQPAMERAEAEALFVREVLPTLVKTSRHATCSQAIATQLHDRMLAAVVRDAWQRELRFPTSIFFALRGAFRHKRMHVFRAGDGRGLDFVMARVPAPLDVRHAVSELKAIVDYLTAHPGCTRTDLLQALGASSEGPRSPEGERIVQQLAWVTERGHVIEYFNGVLALPGEHPAFRELPHHHPRPAPPAPVVARPPAASAGA